MISKIMIHLQISRQFSIRINQKHNLNCIECCIKPIICFGIKFDKLNMPNDIPPNYLRYDIEKEEKPLKKFFMFHFCS